MLHTNTFILTVTDAWYSCNSNTITNRVQETGWWGIRIHEAPECTTSSTGTGEIVVHIHMGTTAHTWWVIFIVAEKQITFFFTETWLCNNNNNNNNNNINWVLQQCNRKHNACLYSCRKVLFYFLLQSFEKWAHSRLCHITVLNAPIE
jgi:hypothetical protein